MSSLIKNKVILIDWYLLGSIINVKFHKAYCKYWWEKKKSLFYPITAELNSLKAAGITSTHTHIATIVVRNVIH